LYRCLYDQGAFGGADRRGDRAVCATLCIKHGGGRRLTLPILNDERLGELLDLMQGADSVELKLTVPD
jgi:hypothetical protein